MEPEAHGHKPNLISIKEVPAIVDIDGLANYLLISKDTALRIWRRLPYICVTSGATVKGGRFVLQDVIEYLRKNGEGYERLVGAERLQEGPVDVQVCSEWQKVTGGRGKAAKRVGGASKDEKDRYNLVIFVRNIS